MAAGGGWGCGSDGYLLSMHEAKAYVPAPAQQKQIMVVNSCNPRTPEMEVGDLGKFKVISGSVTSSRPVWATWKPSLKINK